MLGVVGHMVSVESYALPHEVAECELEVGGSVDRVCCVLTGKGDFAWW
jgi:hypothetical protein